MLVTEGGWFRAKVKRPDGSGYQVSIGGNEWDKGKGKEWEERIKGKCKRIIRTPWKTECPGPDGRAAN